VVVVTQPLAANSVLGGFVIPPPFFRPILALTDNPWFWNRLFIFTSYDAIRRA